MATIKLSTEEVELVISALNTHNHTLGLIDFDTDPYDLEMLKLRFEGIIPPKGETKEEILWRKDFWRKIQGVLEDDCVSVHGNLECTRPKS